MIRGASKRQNGVWSKKLIPILLAEGDRKIVNPDMYASTWRDYMLEYLVYLRSNPTSAIERLPDNQQGRFRKCKM